MQYATIYTDNKATQKALKAKCFEYKLVCLFECQRILTLKGMRWQTNWPNKRLAIISMDQNLLLVFPKPN